MNRDFRPGFLSEAARNQVAMLLIDILISALDLVVGNRAGWSILVPAAAATMQHGLVDTHSRAFGDYDRDVVCLFVRVELPDLSRHGCEQLL